MNPTIRQTTALPSQRLGALFSPAIHLFERLRFGLKAAVISVAFAIPVLMLGVSYAVQRHEQFASLALEDEGIALARVVVDALRATDQASRETLMRASGRAATAGAPVSSSPLQGLQSAVAAHPALRDLDAALSAVQKAHDAQPSADAGVFKVYAAQSKLHASLLTLLQRTSEAAKLSIDPDAGSHAALNIALVDAPRLTEHLGRIQALSAASSQAGKGGPVIDQELARHEALLDLFVEQLKSNTQQLTTDRPELVGAFDLQPALKALSQARDAATDSPGGGGEAQAAKVLAAGNTALEALWALQGRALAQAQSLLVERDSALTSDARRTVAVVAVCIVLATYLFIAFYLAMRASLRNVSAQVEAVGAGDLSQPAVVIGRDEIADLTLQIDAMRQRLGQTLQAVHAAADQVASASEQLSEGTDNLARRTEDTASQLQKSASAMVQMSATVSSTTDSSHQAAALAERNAEVSARGGRVISEVVQTMQGIHATSQRVGEIIGVIDGIAFQTNILALNAAVEAARAGTSGRGFAVVATEVRQLAQRSAGAASEIKRLVSASVEQTNHGAKVVQQAGDTIAEVVQNARQMAQALGAIETASREQAEGIRQVNQTVSELDAMTQNNAALVEESSAAAAAMRSQANMLAAEAGQFKLPVA
jgi:methyl-accepting chemotaxis protein